METERKRDSVNQRRIDYWTPGCGKTLLSNALVNAVTSDAESNGENHPKYIRVTSQLENKYVGDTERRIHALFNLARRRATSGNRVIIVFANLAAVLQSSETVASQLKAEFDEIRHMNQLIVIAETHRADLIAPFLLQNGRFSLHVRAHRPDSRAAQEIMMKHFPYSTSSSGRGQAVAQVNELIDHIYDTGEGNLIGEVQYSDGEKKLLYLKDVLSGAMLVEVINRAQHSAVIRELREEAAHIKIGDLRLAAESVFQDREGLVSALLQNDLAQSSPETSRQVSHFRTLDRLSRSTFIELNQNQDS
ncbi:AAA family ATPase [Streptomyces sp. B21-106]|uniref:AAA family ATPase n=1 Tax=Streptomyces sp. B21-106 TaxID=3039418 RepID=UPI002FF3E83D